MIVQILLAKHCQLPSECYTMIASFKNRYSWIWPWVQSDKKNFYTTVRALLIQDHQWKALGKENPPTHQHLLDFWPPVLKTSENGVSINKTGITPLKSPLQTVQFGGLGLVVDPLLIQLDRIPYRRGRKDDVPHNRHSVFWLKNSKIPWQGESGSFHPKLIYYVSHLNFSKLSENGAKNYSGQKPLHLPR